MCASTKVKCHSFIIVNKSRHKIQVFFYLNVRHFLKRLCVKMSLIRRAMSRVLLFTHVQCAPLAVVFSLHSKLRYTGPLQYVNKNIKSLHEDSKHIPIRFMTSVCHDICHRYKTQIFDFHSANRNVLALLWLDSKLFEEKIQLSDMTECERNWRKLAHQRLNANRALCK